MNKDDEVLYTEFEKNQENLLNLMDRLCRLDFALENIARMCSVLRMGMESPDFSDQTDAAACMWILEYLLETMKAESSESSLSS